MKADVVVDIGNSRIKWGRCGLLGVAEQVSLPCEPGAWEQQFDDWRLSSSSWAIGSVQPETCAAFTKWLKERDQQVLLIDSYRKLPLEVRVDAPDRVGLDRLLNAVAAHKQLSDGQAGIIVDAGSAVTVDLLDETGAFRGGAILPGLRLMAKALHDYTAQLPLVEPIELQTAPGTSTQTAMLAGITHAVLGGIEKLRMALATQHPSHRVFITGGDASFVDAGLGVAHLTWPEMTLEGLRLAAEHADEPAP